MGKIDEPELFLCDICKTYCPIEVLNELSIKDSWHKRSVCNKCKKEIDEKKPKDANVDDPGRS